MLNCFFSCFGSRCFGTTEIPVTVPTTSTAAAPSTPTAASSSTPTTAEKGPSSRDQLSLDAKNSNTSLNLNTNGSIRLAGPPQTISYRKLQEATDNFNKDSRLLGKGGFGDIFKGYLAEIKQEVAVKKHDRRGGQGKAEYLSEVRTLKEAVHPHIIRLIGYCAENDERLLVYEFMPLGSLDTHLFDLKPGTQPLDWNRRMEIIYGVAKGLQYLHDKLKPAIIYRDLKSSNILLDKGYKVKLSDFGLAKLSGNDESYVKTSMGTQGYYAPENRNLQQGDRLTVAADIYSFGIVLLELITGRRAYDETKPPFEQMLIHWARPLLGNEKNYTKLVDPSLGGQYSTKSVGQALVIAASCTQDYHVFRPTISKVIVALDPLQVPSSSTQERMDHNS